jgi:hypothetical protein
MSAVQIGRIATCRKARIHLSIDGHTGCGARNRAHIAWPVVKFHALAVASLCKRCWTDTRIVDAEIAVILATGPAAASVRGFLASVVDSRKTPAQLAAEAAMLDQIRTNMRATGALTPVGADDPGALPRLRSFRGLRNAHAAAVDRDRAELARTP